MIDVVLSRLVQGLLSGIGIGTLFYFDPIIRHMVSQKYRFKYRFNKGGQNTNTIKTYRITAYS